MCALSPAKVADTPDVATLAILAGGEGSRMGVPKGFLEIDGRPILERLLDRIAWPGPTLLVTAPGREHPPGCNRFTREITDPSSGGGPLRGILTALEHLQTPLLVVLTVDMPEISTEQCQPLLETLQNRAVLNGVMFRRISDGRTAIEPFPCALRREALHMIARRLSDGRRSVHGLLDEPGFATIEAATTWNDRIWTNLNSPADLRTYTSR